MRFTLETDRRYFERTEGKLVLYGGTTGRIIYLADVNFTLGYAGIFLPISTFVWQAFFVL